MKPDVPAPCERPAIVDQTTGKLRGGITGKGFLPGEEWRGNAAGRPVGARSKLSEDYLDAIYRQFQEQGPGILRAMATSKKMSERIRFVELVHDLLPRNATLDVNLQPVLPRPLSEMTDADWEIALGIRVTKRGE